MRRVLLAALAALGLFVLAAPPALAIPPTYAYRACIEFNYSTGGLGKMCFKVYVRKQTDGVGFVNTNRHIYAWSVSSGGSMSTDCGDAFNNPATSKSKVSVYRDDDLDPKWWADGPMLSNGNSCDMQWAGDVSTGGTAFQTLRWVVNPNKHFAPDGGDKVLTIFVKNDMSMGCNVPEDPASDYCDRTGPF